MVCAHRPVSPGSRPGPRVSYTPIYNTHLAMRGGITFILCDACDIGYIGLAHTDLESLFVCVR